MKMYSIFDRVAGRYGYPTCEFNNGTATRSFKELLSKSDFDHSEFDLVCVGEFDVDTGKIKTYETSEFVVNGGSLNG